MVEKHYVKYLAPGWFAVVMGTGGLANILFTGAGDTTLLSHLAITLAGLAAVLYLAVLIPWTARWILYYRYVLRDLHHPVSTNFFVTMPVATIIIGTNVSLIWSRYLEVSSVFFITFITWLVGIAGVTLCTFFTSFRFMRVEEHPQPETMNFSWIMSAIANIAVLLVGNPVLALALKCRPEWSMSIFIVNGALLGIGLFLYVFVSAIIFVRLVHHALPPAATTPSFGIFLSGAGLAVTAILDLAKNAVAMGLLQEAGPFLLCALAIWGFGIWIVGIIIMICLHQLRNEGIPFTLGWWAFVFPLAAYTICSQKIAQNFPSPLTSGFALFLTALLVALWMYAALRTAQGVVSGQLFLGKALAEAESGPRPPLRLTPPDGGADCAGRHNG